MPPSSSSGYTFFYRAFLSDIIPNYTTWHSKFGCDTTPPTLHCTCQFPTSGPDLLDFSLSKLQIPSRSPPLQSITQTSTDMISTDLVDMHLKAFARAPSTQDHVSAQELRKPQVSQRSYNTPFLRTTNNPPSADARPEKKCPRICQYIAHLETMKQQTRDYADQLRCPPSPKYPPSSTDIDESTVVANGREQMSG